MALWIAVLESGIHATVAGVIVALTIPARTRIRPAEFLRRGRAILDEFETAGIAAMSEKDVLSSRGHQNAIYELEEASEQAQAPLLRLEDQLHGVVAFGIMPLFALANAGVRLTGGFEALTSPVALGIVLGLVIGKPVGITLASWLAVKTRVADLPGPSRWASLHGVAWLGGIGFTMSLFIAGLAFEGSPLLEAAKLGILVASLIAGLVGWLLLRRGGAPAPP
jgi:NhaA family Na+:H+ antiporter